MACMSKCPAFTVGGICMALAPVFFGLTFWLATDGIHDAFDDNLGKAEDKVAAASWTWPCFGISLVLGIVFLSIGCCCAKGEDDEKNEGGSTQIVVQTQGPQGHMPQGHPHYPGQAPGMTVTPYGAVAPGQMSPMPVAPMHAQPMHAQPMSGHHHGSPMPYYGQQAV